MPALPSVNVAPMAYQVDYIDPGASPSPYLAIMHAQWQNPRDILPVLLLLGGDIVQVAVAQLAATGPGLFAPVAFSFGWLAYSISALSSALGDGRLLPPPEYSSILINAQTGYGRDNHSWALGRLLRDQEHKLKRGSERLNGLTIAFYHSIGAEGRGG